MAALLVSPAHAHIGSPDTFVQANAGPYTVLLAAHPPATLPGALELDLRFNPGDRLTAATASLDDGAPQPLQLVLDGTASTSLWLATPSAHTLRIAVQGSRGPGTYTLTLPAAPSSSAQPPQSLAPLRFLLLLPLAFALTCLKRIPHRRTLAALILTVATALLWLYRPRSVTTLAATLNPDAHLTLTLSNPRETFADLLPDHGKLLHLFLVREPTHDVFLHLHPTQLSPGHFDTALPAMPGGTYTLFADFYHADGAGETASLRLALPPNSRLTARDPDDSTAVLRTSAVSASTNASTSQTLTCALPSGYTLSLQTPTPLAPLRANLFTATLLDPAGHPPSDMAPYLGMSAHAVVLRSDDKVFAHIHPGGTVPMLGKILGAPGHGASAQDATMPGMSMSASSNTATIPYGFPSAGRYRLFVQMRHGPFIETAAFDLDVK